MADALALSGVTALGVAGLSLERKGHDARAAQQYGAAVEAAWALAHPDRLAVAALQLCAVNALTAVAQSRDASAEERAGAAQQLFALQDAALATLQRRLEAGTLLAPRCRPHEVAWYDAHTSAVAKHGGAPPSAAGKAENALFCVAACQSRGMRQVYSRHRGMKSITNGTSGR